MTKNRLQNLRTWIEIDSGAAKKNYDIFRKLIGPSSAKASKGKPRVKLWAVVKSNAYGHGLVLFAKLMQKLGVDGLCVDSLVEGVRLRKEGIKKPILVLGPTLPALYKIAAQNRVTVTVSSFEALKKLAELKRPPEFHLKIDTGMHRQGFYLNDLAKVIKVISNSKFLISKFKGIYTHFASAKDINYPEYTERQFAEFQKAIHLFERAGFDKLVKHAAATGGTLVNPKYRLDAVRVGIGLYGLWPSRELEMQLGDVIRLEPILGWKTVVSDVKDLKKGDYIGYDLVERALKPMKVAILPIGYWHGFPRSLSGTGEMLIRGGRAKVLGRVSMDLVIVALSRPAKPGNIVTIIGRDGREEILAGEVASKARTIHYEFLTRLNPLIERILI
ncbi:MAG: alanine racemase [Candidatus Liptonbacteria bacterium]|nr:alanine racemase [Candidatus Liptonbacteria bacterium]